MAEYHTCCRLHSVALVVAAQSWGLQDAGADEPPVEFRIQAGAAGDDTRGTLEELAGSEEVGQHRWMPVVAGEVGRVVAKPPAEWELWDKRRRGR